MKPPRASGQVAPAPPFARRAFLQRTAWAGAGLALVIVCPVTSLPVSASSATAEGGHDESVPRSGPTVLGIEGTRFTLNGKPTFLLGASYYGGLGAPEDFVRRDLDDLQRHGFNWLRVWATWRSADADVSAVTPDGQAREPYFGRLAKVIAECDRRGLVVDVTLFRDAGTRDPAHKHLANLDAHGRAVETLVAGLKSYRNWYLDLANEHDVRDDRYVSDRELKDLRDLVRRLDPRRLVTASFGGHDLSTEDLQDSLLVVGVDFLTPHRPRGPESPGRTQEQTQSCLARMKELGRLVPVHYQEPFRRGYQSWEPTADDFLTDLRGAVAGGAAGWCFHNGQQRGTPDNRPRRSFDLREQRLFDQLDAEERKVMAGAKALLGVTP
jgi:hypothetical protein